MRLRIVEARDATSVREIASERAAVRLGRDVFVTGRLAPGALAKAVAALRAFRARMQEHSVDAYRAVATSAVRDASNGGVLVERAVRDAQIDLEVIEGVEEARLVRMAVQRAVSIGARRALLVDIGGGSVELTMMSGELARASISLPMGSVRLAESFLDRDAVVTEARRTILSEYIDRLLREATLLEGPAPDLVVATGGNAEAIAQLAPTSTPDGPGLLVAGMRQLADTMGPMTARERRARHQLRGDRADVIVPAMHVLAAIATASRAMSMVVPGVSLKDGIVHELVGRAFRVWDEGGEAAAVEVEAVALGRRYRFDEAHARHVMDLCTHLFDVLATIHDLGPQERTWLRLAALLHDVGDFVGYEAHHKHTYYIVAHTEIMGLGPEAKEVVANIARYHRKGFPEASHPGFRKLDRRGQAVVRKLAAILRLADAFDREHVERVHALDVKIDKNKMLVHARGEGDLALSLWTASRKADMFEQVFGLEVRIDGAARPERSHTRPGGTRRS